MRMKGKRIIYRCGIASLSSNLLPLTVQGDEDLYGKP
jgi:hypothetical protein